MWSRCVPYGKNIGAIFSLSSSPCQPPCAIFSNCNSTPRRLNNHACGLFMVFIVGKYLNTYYVLHHIDNYLFKNKIDFAMCIYMYSEKRCILWYICAGLLYIICTYIYSIQYLVKIRFIQKLWRGKFDYKCYMYVRMMASANCIKYKRASINIFSAKTLLIMYCLHSNKVSICCMWTS